MKMFDDRFHEALGKPVPPNDVKLETQHFSFRAKNTATASAPDYQRAVLDLMKTAKSDAGAAIWEADPNDPIAQAVWHNHQQETATCQWIELPDAFQSPAHVAKLLIKRCQDKLSKPQKPYRLNAEQFLRRSSRGGPTQAILGCPQPRCS